MSARCVCHPRARCSSSRIRWEQNEGTSYLRVYACVATAARFESVENDAETEGNVTE